MSNTVSHDVYIVGVLSINDLTLPGAPDGTTYPTQTFTAVGGETPYTWQDISDPSISSTGLSFDPDTQQLTGTVINPSSTYYYATLTLRVTSTDSQTTTKDFPFVIYTLPAITNSPLHLLDATNSTAFSDSITASVGSYSGVTPPPYLTSITITSGSLPTGLTLGTFTPLGISEPNSIAVNGTPVAVAGEYDFTAEVTDSYGGTGSQELSITVLPITILPTSLPGSSRKASYNQSLHTTGVAPCLWSITAGVLPLGLNLDPNTGVISGIVDPGETIRTYPFTVHVVDNLGNTADDSLSIAISDVPVWVTNTLGSGSSSTVSSVVTSGKMVRPPKDGEFILMGGLSYWTPDTLVQTNNRILIYKDGYFIGEVQPNKIIGTDAAFPITQDLSTLRFSLLVDGEIVPITLNPGNISNNVVLTPVPGDPASFTFPNKDNNLEPSFRVYKNLRLNNFNTINPYNDYTIAVDPDTFVVTITFTIAPLATDTVAVYFIDLSDTYYNQLLAGTQDGSNTTFVFKGLVAPSSVQMFQNGIHLKQGTDFTAQPDIDYKVEYDTSQYRYNAIFRVAPEAEDIIISDYQTQDAGIPVLVTVSFTQISNLIFSLPLLQYPGNVIVYKNGIFQVEKTSATPEGVYTLTYNINNVTLLFDNDAIDTADGDILTVTYEYTVMSNNAFTTALNTTDSFVEYGITASMNDSEQLELVTSNTLDLVIPPLSAEEASTYKVLFGSKYTLNPGKDSDGDFLYYIRSTTGEWKYSSLDLTTRTIIPFNTGEHLRARALHNSALNTAPSYLSEQTIVTDNFHEKYLYSYVPIVLKVIGDA